MTNPAREGEIADLQDRVTMLEASILQTRFLLAAGFVVLGVALIGVMLIALARTI